MKTTKTLKGKYLSYIFSLLVVCTSFSSFAQVDTDDPLLEDTENSFNTEQIDVDGQFRKKTAADRIEEMRKKLEKQNEEMVDKKIEDLRMKEEQKLTKKLQQAFEGQMKSIDEEPVEVQQAAPAPVATPAPVAPVVIAPPPVVEEKKEEPKTIKVTPNFGVTSISSDVVDYETKMNLGLSVDSMLSDYFALGIRLSYSTMSLSEGNPFNISYNNPNYYPYYGAGYASHYGNVREIAYKQIAFGLGGRAYLSKNAKIKPYLGFGLLYNRVSLKYDDKNTNPYQYNNVYYGDEGYSSSYVSGNLAFGSEFSFSETIGMNVEASYAKGFSSGFNSKSNAQSGYLNPDQIKLEKYGQDIEEADFLTLSAGLVLSF